MKILLQTLDYKFYFKIFLLGLIFLFSSNAFAQEKDSIYITGTIVDENSSPLLDAYVEIVETNNGVYADKEGKYKLNITQPLDSLGKITLRYEFIGYKLVEKEIDSTILSSNRNKEIDVKLKDKIITKCPVIYYKKPPFYKRAWNWIKNIFKKEE